MNERVVRTRKSSTPQRLAINGGWSVFPTAAGWTALLADPQQVWRILIGHDSDDSAWSAAQATQPDCEQSEAQPELVKRLQAYFAGNRDDFRDVRVGPLWPREFAADVVRALRKVGYGHTTSYRQLAERAGSPNAARAVGSVMSSNPVPIIIPCHRVLASSGGLGGFSAPTGVTLKQWLLDLEQRPA